MLRRQISRFYTTIVKDNKRYLVNNQQQIVSYWQDPTHTSDNMATVNCISEIPNKFAKKQVFKNYKHHPIICDDRRLSKNSPDKVDRYYQKSLLFNYGFIPQTYESPLTPDNRATNYIGDNDPLDVVEISPLFSLIGKQTRPDLTEVTQNFTPFKSKVLGSFCLIDQGETDWKIILCEEKTANALNLSSWQDLEIMAPGYLKFVMHFFKNSKALEGKKLNHIEFGEKIFDVEETKDIIQECHLKYLSFLNDDMYSELRKKYHIL